jgi:hypothetical protein
VLAPAVPLDPVLPPAPPPDVALVVLVVLTVVASLPPAPVELRPPEPEATPGAPSSELHANRTAPVASAMPSKRSIIAKF